MSKRITFGDLNASHIGMTATIDDGRQTVHGVIETIAHYGRQTDEGVVQTTTSRGLAPLTGVTIKGRLAVQRQHSWPITILDGVRSELHAVGVPLDDLDAAAQTVARLTEEPA